ncbi:MAG: hypothetical protein HFG05_03950 [Oscillibacter sp.]|nr:hypothetical protein [Oscillibacter sp.]
METLAQIERGTVKFIDAELAPKIPTNIPNGQIKKIAALAGAAYAVRTGLQRAVSSPTFAAMGAVDGEGNVDIAGLAEALSAQIPESGFKVTVPILGELTFYREDIERLQSYIMEG